MWHFWILPVMFKEFMIWATVSSWSCFCWLYIASPSLAAKNIILNIIKGYNITLAVELANSHLFFSWSKTKPFHGFWAEMGMLHWLKGHWARKTLVGTWQEQVGNSFYKTRCIRNVKPYQLTFYTSLYYNPLIYLALWLPPYPFVMLHYGH